MWRVDIRVCGAAPCAAIDSDENCEKRGLPTLSQGPLHPRKNAACRAAVDRAGRPHFSPLPLRLMPHVFESVDASYDSFNAANTCSACPSGFTFEKIFAIFPSAPTTKVLRSMPMYFLPYILFSFHTPYASATE